MRRRPRRCGRSAATSCRVSTAARWRRRSERPWPGFARRRGQPAQRPSTAARSRLVLDSGGRCPVPFAAGGFAVQGQLAADLAPGRVRRGRFEGQRHLRQLARGRGASRTSRTRPGCAPCGQQRRTPASISSTQVHDRKATLKLARTCFDGPLLDISEPMRSGSAASLNRRSMAGACLSALAHQDALLGELRHRHDLRLAARVPCISACGATMNAIGCLAEGRRHRLQPAGGRPMILWSSPGCPAAHDLVAVADLQVDLHARVLVGEGHQHGGSRYSAVVIAPTRSVPGEHAPSAAISPACATARGWMRRA